ncbi:twin-arginine translocase TatA/TatE family subunit [Trichlorobacter lovleyi]|jgi:twin arginine-targeting protein translocase, TatA/E family|uniref:Sec-independent protein translocase protein TatA n=1 Tax=Trichlorobacter lovleyi (strain ATCC BAA-1151 / DSM 17278 / SZ) TaxID=398767 RepID=B3E5J3_TRIL1|nr:twin-arginine translocase TatA/TatE family subunit [Trichlorobacter lovleyi]ACD94664.1 twin-arginine translocation protein, TatA/E family subunit [Trichlorobacter lovleyi SZ]QOX78095.1 twin-arginine translocase TatA/TatE family subunit [Trichlorobacter lovleyi]
MFGFGMPELIVIMSIVLVIFGAGKLPEVGRAVGKGIRNFKEASEGKEAIELDKKA